MVVSKEKLPVRKMLETAVPMSEEASKIILGLDDLLVLSCECDDENDINDIEEPIYIYAIPVQNRDFIPGVARTTTCPHCNTTAAHGVHQYVCREIDDCPIRGHRTIIRILHFSIICSSCEKTWTPPIFSASRRARLTKRHAEIITDASFQKLSFEQVAYNFHVSSTTVEDLFVEEAKKREGTYKFETHKHIGIDETLIKTTPKKLADSTDGELSTASKSASKTDKGSSCIVLLATDKESDVEFKHHGIIDIVKSKRDTESVIALLDRFDDPDKIETVTMDMCSAYRLAVETALPKARIIVDRFHLVQSLNDKLRRTASNLYYARKKALEKELGVASDDDPAEDSDEYEYEFEVDEATGEIIGGFSVDVKTLPKGALNKKYEILMDNYLSRALTANPKDLAPTTKVRLRRLFKAFPEFQIIYEIKEHMRKDFFEANTAEEARAIADREQSKIPSGKIYRPLRTYFKTLNSEEWSKHIYEYFNDPKEHRYSNAALENINSHIKDINRMCRSLTWDILRLKVLYGDISVRKHKKRWTFKQKTAVTEFLSCVMDRREVTCIPSTDVFEYIFGNAAFRHTSLGKVFAGQPIERCIHMLLHNDNMAGALLAFIWKNPHFAEPEADDIEEVGIIHPLYLYDWNENARQYLAILDADAKLLEEQGISLL